MLVARRFQLAIRIGTLIASSAAVSAAELPLMPLPSKAILSEGRLRVDSSFRVGLNGYSDLRLMAAVDRFVARVSRQTGMPMLPGKAATLEVECKERGSLVPALGEDESYHLEIRPDQASLEARTVTGAIRGLETFAQLIRPGPDGFQAPTVTIEDRPRFPWRGLMLDAVRHWMPVSVVERNLDAMAAVKLNVFHWHLSDDQGFRVESRRYPRLTQMGSDGNFYTQADVRQVVAYAQDRGIRVIPEFDMPGHTTAWFVGYPELASAPGPYAIERKWGVFAPSLDLSREATYAFLDGLIGEMAALFPDPYFHVGGDEVDGAAWRQSRSIQAFAREHQMATSRDLQAYFNHRLQKLLQKHGKIMIGWDEVLGPGLARETVIQSWRGQASLAEAAVRGHGAVLSFGYYLDQLWPASRHYAIDPLDGAAGDLTPEQTKNILGGEACMWSEYVNAETVDSRIWPRLAAIAERLWSPRDVTDAGSMYERLANVSRTLEWTGVEHQSALEPMLDRLASGRSSHALRVLAGVSEALGIEGRRNLAENASLVPLNRFVDAVRPESERVRTLELAVKSLTTSSAAIPELRATLTEWAANEAELRPLGEANLLVAEVVPLATHLAAAGRIGLRALELIETKQPAPGGWVEEQSRQLDRLEQPTAQVRLAAVRPVRLLVATVGPLPTARLRLQLLDSASVRRGIEHLCNTPATVLNWTIETNRSTMRLNSKLWVVRPAARMLRSHEQ
jgi:hexosaminidase